MRDEHGLQNQGRPLRPEEAELIRFLLLGRFERALLEQVSSARVVDMKDGGMGGIRFVGPQSRIFGRTLAEAKFVDSDGVLVSIVVNADQDGQLFEVDFWKVDFSLLKRYPAAQDLKITS